MFNSFSFSAMAGVNTLWVTEAFPSFALRLWVQSQGIAGANIQIAAVVMIVGFVEVPA